MKWTTRAEVLAQVEKLWSRGTLLGAYANSVELYPKRLTLNAPSSNDISTHFAEVAAWQATLKLIEHVEVSWRQVRHPVHGRNQQPQALHLLSIEAAAALLGREAQLARFRELLSLVNARLPALLEWVRAQPMRALDLSAEFGRLIDVVEWFLGHPRAAVYLRQIDVPGVHSKWIESHLGVLGELLDLALDAAHIDQRFTGSSGFCARYGLRDRAQRVRFRLLEPGGVDSKIDASAFANLNFKPMRVLITENEINFLSLPDLSNTLAIFGAGYGFEALESADWLKACDIHYWGDIDTHGFAILDQLRGHLAHAQALLMDRVTLLAHRELWGEETAPTRRELSRLSSAELKLYNDLRDQRFAQNLRLEQERIGYAWVRQALSQLVFSRD